MQDINRFSRLSQALVHFVIDRASLFTDQRISGLPITCQVQAFQKSLRRHFRQFSYRFQFFLFDVVVIDAWSRYFVSVESSCLPTHNIVPHISGHDLPYPRTTKKYEYFPSMVIFQFSRFQFFPLWSDGHRCMEQILCNCRVVLFANSQYRSTHFWAWPSIS